MPCYSLRVRCVDEVPTRVEVRVKQLERRFLAHFTKHGVPLVADVGAAEREWGDADAGEWAEDAVPAESCRRFGRRFEEICHFFQLPA